MNARAAIGCLLLLIAVLEAPAQAQHGHAHYESTFQNARVQVFHLTLTPGASTSVYLANHDQVWIALADVELAARSSEHQTQHVALHRGDARFVGRGSIANFSLDSSAPADLIVIIINQRDREAGTCDCTGSIGKVVCGCSRSGGLPEFWAVAIGKLTLAKATLRSGQSYPEPTDRDDMLLVAITTLSVRDATGVSATASAREMRLGAGEVVWLPAGTHRLQNAAGTSAQFITLEF